jgi:hypothetical protein
MLNAKKSIRKCHAFCNQKFYLITIKQQRKFAYITYKTEKKIPLVIDMEELVAKIDKIEKQNTKQSSP